MRRVLSVVVLFAFAAVVSAQDKKGADQLTLSVASGAVDKFDKDVLTVKPRGADGKFQKALALKVTGTSKVTVLAPQKRGENVVFTQRDADAKDLHALVMVLLCNGVENLAL